MLTACVEALGLTLGVGGTLLVMVACGLPAWKVSAFIEGNILVAQSTWDGLWMSCVMQSTGQTQCKIHDSMLALRRDIQAARALTVASAVVAAAALAAAATGARCTACVAEARVKERFALAGGAALIFSALLALVPLCWIAHGIIAEFHDLNVHASQKREIGASIYIGWAGAALLLLAGGALLCCSFSRERTDAYAVQYARPADKKQYV